MLKIKRNNLIAELADKGMTATDIAREIGCNPRTIANVIRKKHNPSLGLAASLAKLFNKPIPELFEFEEENQ